MTIICTCMCSCYGTAERFPVASGLGIIFAAARRDIDRGICARSWRP